MSVLVVIIDAVIEVSAWLQTASAGIAGGAAAAVSHFEFAQNPTTLHLILFSSMLVL